MLSIRVSLLHYPQFVEEHSQVIRSLLAAQEPFFLFLEDSSCGGHRYVVEERLRQACDFAETDWLLTVGGTWPAPGPSPSEIMPLATASVLERSLPGIMELPRAEAARLHPRAMLDCGMAGIRGSTFLLNLPADSDLISIYLQTLSPVLAQLLLALHDGREKDQEDRSVPESAQDQTDLKANEFASFLSKSKSVQTKRNY